MDLMFGALILVSMIVVGVLFINNVRMTNRVLKDLEEQRKHWNWN